MSSDNNLWYKEPANQWTEALPIGNGRLGAMIFGKVSDERITLNEDSIWYGGPKKGENPDTLKYLDEVRELLLKGEPEKAEHLARMTMYSTPKYFNPYQPLGDLRLFFYNMDKDVEDYKRQLNLTTGLVNVSFKQDGYLYNREIFSTYADSVIVMKLTTDNPKGITFSVNINRRPYEGISKTLNNDTIIMEGECGSDGVKFAAWVKATSDDGKISTLGDFISVENSKEVTLILAANSSFREKEPSKTCEIQLGQATKLGYIKLKDRHIEDYFKLFNTNELNLINKEDYSNVPTNERLKNVGNNNGDLGLIELLYNYGRYLLISCSRPGTLPANLQGIWNDSFTPPWESKYTININTEMNYWPAEICNLSECHEPLFYHIERMVINGRKTAKELYGCKGFVAHHNTNIWAETRPECLLFCSIWPMGGAWLSLHMWEHFLFTRDVRFIKEKGYPTLKESAQFFLDYLTETSTGRLVSGPSISPENTYRLPNGNKGELCMGASMDTQIIRELFNAVIEASKILDNDKEFVLDIKNAIKKLPKIEIGKYGQIMEWAEDYDEVDPGHRHISQLFALHPGSQITKETPELLDAARKTIERRLANGGGHTGWSKAWIINFWARLYDGDTAYENIIELLKKSMYTNLFDAHPPFQIDGNFGVTAAIGEMLLQSHTDIVEVLPALPQKWRTGSVRGLKARGAFAISIEWKDSKLTKVTVKSLMGEKIRLDAKGLTQVLNNDVNVEVNKIRDTIIEFNTVAGETYYIN